MASISFDPSTGWWSIRYFAGPDVGRVKRSLCRHPTAWSKAKPPRRVNATDKFVAWCRRRKVVHVQAVTVQQCDEWIAHRLAEGGARSTVVTERGFLAPIWVQARRHRLIVENPWEIAKVPGKPKEEELKYWTVDELRKLFAACEGWIRDYALLDANTGLRVGAMTGLTWADVDFPGSRIVVPKHLSKSGKSYAVPFNPTSEAVLARRWLESKSKSKATPIFPGRDTGRSISRNQVYKSLRVAVRRAGIRDFGRYTHALRHSFAVALVEADVGMRVIQELLGHSSIKTTEIYAKVSAQKARSVMEGFNLTPSEPQAAPDSGTGPAPATSPSAGSGGRRRRGSSSDSPSG
jgi:integrase